jgi:hypothetical protein
MKQLINFLVGSFLFLILTSSAKPSEEFLKIGDQAPPLNVSSWVKGKPIDSFKKGQIYVIDVSWCG